MDKISLAKVRCFIFAMNHTFHGQKNPRVQCSVNCFQCNGSTIQTGFSVCVQLKTETNLGLFRDGEFRKKMFCVAWGVVSIWR